MKHQYEAIIVGAGLYAALEASRSAKTAVLSKLHPIRSNTGTAQGGIGAASRLQKISIQQKKEIQNFKEK